MSRSGMYTLAYRTEAVKLVLEQGLPLAAACLQLGMPKSTLNAWVNAAKGLTVVKGGSPPGARTVGELEAEIIRLRKERDEARMERDILGKATAYFAKGPKQGTRT